MTATFVYIDNRVGDFCKRIPVPFTRKVAIERLRQVLGSLDQLDESGYFSYVRVSDDSIVLTFFDDATEEALAEGNKNLEMERRVAV